MTHYDLLVVGAGPAGLTLAWKTAERGLRVVVVDQKPSADHAAYLTSASFMDLGEWGIPEEVAQPIETLHLASQRASVTVSGSCWMLNRRRLLAWLAERAQACGAALQFNSRITDVVIANDVIQRVSVMSHGTLQEFGAGVFADCSGAGRVLARHARLVTSHQVKQTLGAEYVVPLLREPHTLDFYFGSHFGRGYGWLFPVDDRIAVLGYGTLDPGRFQEVRSRLDGMFDLPRVRARVERRPLEAAGGAFLTGLPLKRFHRGNIILVGDCALQGNPVIGEGIRFVMDAARIAADAVAETIRTGNLSLLGRYSSAWVKKYYPGHRAGYLAQRMTSCLTADDNLCDRTLQRLARAPSDAVVRVIRGDVSYRSVVKDSLRVCVARLRQQLDAPGRFR